jgi:hypothetical protein
MFIAIPNDRSKSPIGPARREHYLTEDANSAFGEGNWTLVEIDPPSLRTMAHDIIRMGRFYDIGAGKAKTADMAKYLREQAGCGLKEAHEAIVAALDEKAVADAARATA